MSERKTAEVKFRCTPSFKASLAAAADAADQSMSEYIESALWAHRNARIADEVVGGAIAAALDPADFREGIAQARVALDAGPEAVAEFLTGETVLIDAGADDPAILNPEGPVVCKGCRPWEFCACKAGA